MIQWEIQKKKKNSSPIFVQNINKTDLLDQILGSVKKPLL